MHDRREYRALPQGSDSLGQLFAKVRAQTLNLVEGLSEEDQVVQSMEEASPAKWHLAHTTWFFETFLLKPYLAGYQLFSESFEYLFNSYYEAVGPQHPRPRRGLLTRPARGEVLAYRRHVDDAMALLLDELASVRDSDKIGSLIELGVHHEMQHQELIVTDLLHVFSFNPLYPAYIPYKPAPAVGGSAPASWVTFEGGVQAIGHNRDGFAFDCETPRHEVVIQPFRLASRPVTNAEWLEFIADNGYRTPTLWLSDGWARAQQEKWQAPLYWQQRDGQWWSLTLSGRQPLDPEAPVCHISYYEADAFARWVARRLPTEAEWEVATKGLPIDGNMIDTGFFRPLPANAIRKTSSLAQMFGDVWEWTQSPFVPYPGFKAAAGAIGEYNGKFMCNQLVLRGGSCVTPERQIRSSYRNFFYPHQRWQFSGVRLAEDA